VDEPGTVAVNSWLPYPFSQWCTCVGGRADVPVGIRETGVQETAINYPRLGSLQLVDQKGGTFSIAGERVELRLREPSGATTAVKSHSADDTCDLAARGGVTYVIRLGGLPAGSYHGKVLVSGPDSTEVSKDFTINVRDFVVWPFLVLLLGVIGSFFLYSWMREGRARDLRSAAIARCGENLLANGLPPEPDPVRRVLLKRLHELQEQNQVDRTLTAETVATSLKDIEKSGEIYRQGIDQRDRVDTLLETYPSNTDELAKKKGEYVKTLNTTFQSIQTLLVDREGQGIGPPTLPQRKKSPIL